MNLEEKNRLLRDHPEYANLIHWVSGTPNKRGHWRVKPYTYFKPSVNQLRHQLNFAKTATKQFGKKGFVDQTLIVAHEVGKALRGKKVTKGFSRREYEILLKLKKLEKLTLKLIVPRISLRI